MCRNSSSRFVARQPSGSALIYQPMLLGTSQVRVSDSKAGVDVTQDVTVLAPISDGAVAVDWDRAMEAGLAVADSGALALRRRAVRSQSPARRAKPRVMKPGIRTFLGGCSEPRKSIC